MHAWIYPPGRHPSGQTLLPGRHTPWEDSPPRQTPPPPPRQTPPFLNTTGYGQQVGGTHPPGMHTSCTCRCMLLQAEPSETDILSWIQKSCSFFIGSNVYDVYNHCWELVDPLNKLVELSSEVFGGLDPGALRTQAQDLILQVWYGTSFVSQCC